MRGRELRLLLVKLLLMAYLLVGSALEALCIVLLLELVRGIWLARLVCIRHGHLLVVEHLLLRMLETGVIGSRLERRHRHIHVLSFLLLHTVISASLGVIALRHHIVGIEVIANVYSAAVEI